MSIKKAIKALSALTLLGFVFISGCAVNNEPCKHMRTDTRTEAATCTETGVKNEICLDCGETVKTSSLPVKGHGEGAIKTNVSPAKAANGSASISCGDCDQLVGEEILPYLNDTTYEYTVIDTPTCTKTGKAVYKSARYGDFTVELPVKSHEYAGTWATVQEPSCKEYGKQTRMCADCSATQTNYVEKTPHQADESTGFCTVCGEKAMSVGLTYTPSADGTYYIVSDTNRGLTDNDLVIPAYYNGLPVKEIAAEGFAYRAWLYSVSVPHTIERVGAGAFSSDNGLKTIYWNATACEDFNARNWVFLIKNATPLNVVFGNTVQHVPSRLFFPLSSEPEDIPNVGSIRFAKGAALESVGEYAFYKYQGAEIDLPEYLQDIGDYAFYGAALKKIALPDSVAKVGDYAFYSNELLEEISFGCALKKLGESAFYYCNSLREVDLSSTALTELGNDCFKSCTALQTAVFPSTLTKLGRGAFKNCAALRVVNIGNGVETIGESAFENCASLTMAIIPEAVKTLGAKAFKECESLSVLYFAAENCADLTASDGVFYGAGRAANGIKAYFMKTVRYIPSNLFYASADPSCQPKLTSVQIAADLLEIGAYAFTGVKAEIEWTGSTEHVTVGEGNGLLSGFLA